MIMRSFLYILIASVVIKEFRTSYIKLLIIGDSVDRCLLQDWCTNNYGTQLTERSTIGTNFSDSISIHQLLKPHGMRRKSWDVRICESFSRQVILSLVHNKFGVKPCSPWHCPIATMAGLELELVGNTSIDQARNLSHLFNIGLQPSIPPLVVAFGGKPHGVLLNSAFWDLSHPDPQGIREKHPEMWLQSWATNVSQFMQIVRLNFPETRWFAWHTGNWFHTVQEGHHWNTAHALQLLDKMNDLSEQLAMRNGFEWLAFHRFRPLQLRDMMHPTSPSLLRLMEMALKSLGASLPVGWNFTSPLKT